RLLSVREEVVQTIDFEPGVREGPAAAHHLMKEVVMFLVERRQNRDDRVPRVGSSGDEHVATDVARKFFLQTVNRWGCLFPIRRRIARDDAATADTHDLR